MREEKILKTLARIETKVDGLHDDIVELKDADEKLHKRISEKDTKIEGVDKRVSKLESVVQTIKWVIGITIASITALFTYQSRN